MANFYLYLECHRAGLIATRRAYFLPFIVQHEAFGRYYTRQSQYSQETKTKESSYLWTSFDLTPRTHQ
jgi:hypothetical protein